MTYAEKFADELVTSNSDLRRLTPRETDGGPRKIHCYFQYDHAYPQRAIENRTNGISSLAMKRKCLPSTGLLLLESVASAKRYGIG